MRLRCIWYRTHLIPGLSVSDFLSPWTDDPDKIKPPGQMVSNKFDPHGQMEYSRDHLSRGTKLIGDNLSMKAKFWESSVHGDRTKVCFKKTVTIHSSHAVLWIVTVFLKQTLVGDCLYRGTHCRGPNVRGAIVFGTQKKNYTEP